MRIIITVFLCVLALPPPLQGVEKPPLDLSPDDWAVLEKGELVFKLEDFQDDTGNINHRLKTFRIINAAPHEVWKVLSEPEKDVEWIPGVDASEVMKRDENYVDVHYEVKVLFMSFQFNIHRVFHRDILFIKNDLIDDMENDLKVSDSYYALYPYEDGKKTIMNYSLHLVVSRNIPQTVADWFARQNCRAWMESLKMRAESKGEWKK